MTLKRIEISAAAIIDALNTLDTHAVGLEGLAESLERQGAAPRDVAQARDHARALAGLREDLALSAPDNLDALDEGF